MTITDLTVGTAATGNNASVTPGTPSGLADGDLMLIVAAIRNSGAGTVNTPSGWTRLTPSGNVAILGRYYVSGDTMPLVTFTGGVANADTYARALKCRGAGKDVLAATAPVTQANASAANIAYPAVNVLGPGHLVLAALWKQDDATSLTTPSGFTAQGLTNMTTGDDMLVALFTYLQVAEADISAGSSTVTGGVAAISSAAMLSIKPAPSITVQELDLWPPRTQITVSGLTIGDDIELFRVVGGVRTAVRAGSSAAVTDTSFIRVDGEIPFDVPVSYVAAVNAAGEYTTAAVTYDLPGGKAVLSDAISGLSAEVVIESWPEKVYDLQASVIKAGGRNIVVSSDVGMFEATLQLFFEEWSSSENFLTLVRAATEGTLQLRRPLSTYDGVDCYIGIVGMRERRFSQDGTDGRRLWQVTVAETDGWSSALEAQGFTYNDLATAYTGLTYDDVDDDYATYLAVAQADLS